MDTREKAHRLKSMLTQVTPGPGVEAIRTRRSTDGGLESFDPAAEATASAADKAVEKLAENREEDLTPDEMFALEAIILPRERPVVFVRDTAYDDVPEPWLHLNEAAVRAQVGPLFRSIARVEVPSAPWIPFAGTGFVVGKDLLMTNRHVAKLFSDGVGLQVRYREGDAAVDFNRHVDSQSGDTTALFKVSKVEMVHPYWDMALIRVGGLTERFRPLSLSILTPDELIDREVIAVGFPARDDRNDLDVQDRIFQRTYNVKRMQPGRIQPRRRIRSFENVVNAITHDASTLGGNSGSAVIDLKTGEVVGLHFAGVYLDANYAVPAYELARDKYVTKVGVNFAGSLAATTEWSSAWDRVGTKETVDGPATAPATQPAGPGPAAQSPSAPAVTTTVSGSAQWTIPIHISVSVGQPQQAGTAESIAVAETEAAKKKMKMPVIFGGLEHRKGYQSGFLQLADGDEVPMPELTELGTKVAAPLEDGSTELKYHKFSVVMHKGRRLAIFTAANVDWRRSVRLIDGRKPTRGELTKVPEGTPELWTTDWRIDPRHQLPDVFFTEDRGAFDKGHLVRRDDVVWGKTFKDMQKANGDTYHTTNCSPQRKPFNQAPHGEDNWGDLENLVQKETKAERAIIFSGPVLAEDDPLFEGVGDNGKKLVVPVPRRFWKIIVVKGENGPEAYGFVLEQDLSDLEFAVPPEWEKHMKSIDEIEELLFGLASLDELKPFDRSNSTEGVRIGRQLV